MKTKSPNYQNRIDRIQVIDRSIEIKNNGLGLKSKEVKDKEEKVEKKVIEEEKKTVDELSKKEFTIESEHPQKKSIKKRKRKPKK